LATIAILTALLTLSAAANPEETPATDANKKGVAAGGGAQKKNIKKAESGSRDNADDSSTKGGPEKRKWRPVASLTSVVPQRIDQCIDLLLKPTEETKENSNKTKCEVGASANLAAKYLLNELVPNAPKDRTWIIQIVRFKSDPATYKLLEQAETLNQTPTPNNSTINTPESIEPRQVRTYTYYPGAKLADMQKLRVWGKPEISTLYIGAKIRVGDAVEIPPDQQLVFPSPDGDDLKESAEKTQKLLAELNFDITNWGKNLIPAKYIDSTGATKTVFLSDAAFEQNLFVAFKKKNPAWLDNLLTLVKIAYAQGKVKPKSEAIYLPPYKALVSLYGIGELIKVPVPSDIWVQAGTPNIFDSPFIQWGDDTTDAFTATLTESAIDNEGRYHIDFSVGIPTKKIDQIEYSVENSRLQSRKVPAESVLGLFNWSPWAIDIKDPKQFWHPRLLVGVGLRGRILDHTFFGVGMGFGVIPALRKVPFLNEIQPYAGLQRTVTQIATPATIGTTTSTADMLPKTSASWKLAIGINVPIKSVADRLLKKKE